MKILHYICLCLENVLTNSYVVIATSKVAFQTEISGPKNTKISIEDPTVSVIKNILKFKWLI